MNTHNQLNKSAITMLVIGGIAIGFAPILAKLSVDFDLREDQKYGLSPVGSAFWRIAFAAPVFWLLALLKRNSINQIAVSDLKFLFLPGFIFAIDLSLWHWSFEYTSVANSTLEANLATIIVSVFAWVFLGERFTWLFPCGVALSIIGIAGLVGVSFSETWFGDLLGIATAFAYASYIISIKTLVKKYGVIVLLAASSSACALFLLPIGLLTPGSLIASTWQAWLALAGLALISHVLGQGFIAASLKHLPASFSSATLLLQPLSAAALSWIILGQSLTPLQISAGILVLIGVFISKAGTTNVAETEG